MAPALSSRRGHAVARCRRSTCTTGRWIFMSKHTTWPCETLVLRSVYGSGTLLETSVVMVSFMDDYPRTDSRQSLSRSLAVREGSGLHESARARLFRYVLDFFGDRCRSFVSRCEQRKHPHEPCRTYYFPPRRSLILLGQHGVCLATSRTGLRRTYSVTFQRSSGPNCYRFAPRRRERSRN